VRPFQGLVSGGVVIDYLRMLRVGDWIKFYPLIPLAGAVLAGTAAARLLAILVIYCALIGYAFVVNNYCDVEIDRLHQGKLEKNKNPLTSGRITRRGVQITMLLLAAITMSSLFLSDLGFVLVFLNLVLVTAYSGGIRLKEWPVLDIITHGLMFGALPFLAGFALAEGEISRKVLMLSAIPFLLACEALIAHQVMEYEMDVASTRTTVTIIGQQKGLMLLGASAVVSLIILLALTAQGELPAWAAALTGGYLLAYPAYSCRGLSRDLSYSAGTQ
jgi:4-hydroxybenzoate polyprenyltransferase